MSFKVYRTEKTLYVVDNDTSVIAEALWQNVVISRKEVASTDYYFNGFSEHFAPNNMLTLAEIQKKDGSAYTESEFLKFIDSVYGYEAGVSGTVTLTGGKKVKSITAVSTLGGTITIDGGNSITIPANGSFTEDCNYNLVNPVIVFTGTVSYYVSYIS